MNSINLTRMSVENLVDRFVAITLAQDKALLEDDYSKVAQLFRKMEAVKEELKGRRGDQRRALLPLLSHPNAQVRVKAAKATLALAPDAARRVLEAVAESGEQPQALEAGMSLWNLDRGVFKPT
ncbi:MAG: DUF2019 domain-containing protein [Pseudorhodoplanes sp.]|nr:DUF2019 domain-containing protein [Pseudorhodoplanes sp.]